MSSSPIIQRFAAHEWSSYRDLRLRALAESPDAFGSTFEVECARSESEWARRLEAGVHSRSDLPLVARVDSEAIGLAWARVDEIESKVVHLFQVWVTPENRRRGAGHMLLDATVRWAQELGAQVLALDVTCGDTAATRLYTRAGFRPSGDPQPLRPGSPLLKQPMRLTLSRDTAASSA